jgi:acyl-CoA synthetase (AMP-forming)/AMP-acid ligase II
VTGLTLAGALDAAWRRWPERTALQLGDRHITYSSFGAQVGALAASYQRMGIERGDRVVCQLSNRPEHLVAAAAAWKRGAVHVGVDHKVTGRELAWLVGHTGAAALLYEPDRAAADPFATARLVLSEHPTTVIVVLGDKARTGLTSFRDLVTPTGEGLALEDAIQPQPHGPTPEDPAVIFVTSGTTGVPKTPLGFHGPFAAAWAWLGDELGFGPTDVHLGHLPLSHGFGLSMAVLALMSGGRLVLLQRFSPEEALRIVTTEGVTVLHGTPAHFILLRERLDPARHDLSGVRVGVGTASVFPPALRRWILDDLDMRFMLMYGSSEGVSVTTTDRDEILAGSVGRPEPGSLVVVGPDRRPLAAGEVGEIAFRRGPWPIRYWGSDGEAAADEQGHTDWYYTGDLGRLDADGRLYVLGRLKHQIDRGGIKIDPGEVEASLLRCRGVADAAVIGTPHAVLGETVCACVVASPGYTPTLEEIRATLGDSLAPHKLPQQLHLLARLPRTPIGKVDRERLRASIEAGPEAGKD